MKSILSISFFVLTFFTLQAQAGSYKVSLIGFYNLENLFDTIDNPTTNDADFLPNGRLRWDGEKYKVKLANMARVISEVGQEVSPDGLAVLGVSEVENKAVLEDLVVQPAIKDRNYEIVLIEGRDERGIDNGLLYQPKYFEVKGAKSIFIDLRDPQTGEQDFTRDILYVAGELNGELLHILVCHWPSRSGGESASAWARNAAADRCKAVADSIWSTDRDANIIVMGDLNDDPTNRSLTVHLKASGKMNKVREDGFYNTMYKEFKNGNGSLAYRDSWNLFDQICISRSLIGASEDEWAYYKSVVYRQPWMIQQDGRWKGYPFRTFSGGTFIGGYSDHLPVYIVLLKKV